MIKTKLKNLIQNIENLEIKGSKEIEITSICSHSKKVIPGALFIAKKGKTYDGTKYIPEAVASGASSVLTDIYDPFLQVTQLIHPDVHAVEAKLAAHFFQKPSLHLHVIGITGTCGKTTTSFLIKHILDTAGIFCGLLGGIECLIGKHQLTSPLTTQDVITNHKLLQDMVVCDCKAAVMEVSSHALDQNRVEEITFKMAVFTNLTEEHLDYHLNMEKYQKAKGKLFSSLTPDAWAIFNVDDPISFPTKAKIFTYGIEKKADLGAKPILLTDKRSECMITYRGEERKCKSFLVGKHNIYNLLAGIAACLCYGLSLDTCLRAVESFKGAKGRLQQIKEGVFVDHAHKENALKTVLQTLRNICKGRLITVFGCGGDRDKAKRPKMGKVAVDYSDVVIVTSDNPRSENPEKIIEEILLGCEKPVLVEPDREKAIRCAILQKKTKDIVLIAGKGHEKMQVFSHQMIAFDDTEVVKRIYEEEGIDV